jgi:hypothetical protein
MPKGFFTQSASILLSKPTTLDAIVPLLSEFQIAKRLDKPTAPELSGPSLVFVFRPEVNGYVNVDVRNQKWPDHMGDPQNEPMLFAGWTMGHWGPYTFPGSLQRAEQQLWAWPDGKGIARCHTALIHITSSYVFGGGKDMPIVPHDYDPLTEMQFVTRMVLALLKHPDALAYFNPNGEILADEKVLRKSVNYHAEQQIPPFDIWVNVRVLNPNNGWLIMDTVGMEQLDRPDLEACFPSKAYDLGEVSYFLRNCSLYLLGKGEVIKDKDTMNGPGNINWQAHHVEKELSAPPRRLIRWFPLDGSKAPPEMVGQKKKSSLVGRIGRLFGEKWKQDD